MLVKESLEEFLNEGEDVLDTSQIYAKLKLVQPALQNIKEEDYESTMYALEDAFGENIAGIADRISFADTEWAIDYLHYHQRGMTGGPDTGEFLDSVEDINNFLSR